MWSWASRWWLALWPTPRIAATSGRTTAVASKRSSIPSPASGSGPRQEPGKLGELPLPGRLGGPRRLAAGERDRLRLGLDAESGPRSAPPRRTRSGSSANERSEQRAQDARLEVVQAGGRVDRRAAGKRHRDRVDREVAQPQIDLDRRRRAGRRCRSSSSRRGRRPARSRNRRRARTGGRRRSAAMAARRRLDVAVEGDVDVDDVAAEDCVADRAADDPGAVGDVAEPERATSMAGAAPNRSSSRVRWTAPDTRSAPEGPRDPGAESAGDLVVDRAEAARASCSALTPRRPARRSGPRARRARPRSRGRGRRSGCPSRSCRRADSGGRGSGHRRRWRARAGSRPRSRSAALPTQVIPGRLPASGRSRPTRPAWKRLTSAT